MTQNHHSNMDSSQEIRQFRKEEMELGDRLQVKLNEKSLTDRYHLPNITDIIDKIGKRQYFTTLDLASGFHQREMEKEDIPKTTFPTENRHYEFRRIPFGLKNATSTFQRVMDNIVRFSGTSLKLKTKLVDRIKTVKIPK